MFNKLLQMVFGSKNDRDMKKLIPIVAKINSLEDEIKKMSNEDIRMQTEKFKARLVKGELLIDILPEAFATVREVSLRTMGMRHFDVQMMGGITLHFGSIAEMKTGEGKTLTSTLPIYLNALSGNGVHIVTVNDYLAKRDANWMRPIYEFLGVSVGFIQHDMEHEERQRAYLSDITYGTNNEFGFDYLRDNMVSIKEHRVQRGHNYAIVDEVDSILIDEARTPLIISGPSDDATDKYEIINKIIPKLVEKEDFEIDEKAKNALLTEKGVSNVEKYLDIENLYDKNNVELVHHVSQALKAHKLFHRDVDYVVSEGEVIIVDEFTGRLMTGRRYSDGLHQAIEAKEFVEIARETQTLATITFQNYFRIYKKLAGMTGTADTEAEEFAKIYNLDVVVIPPNVKMSRTDHPDRVYRTQPEKYKAIIDEILDCYKKKQPVLVGTISIERSEYISDMLKKHAVPHNVLNAKFHEKEADIIANAGRPGAVTIATNMAGRGTDIVLGGSPRYKEALEKIEEKDGQELSEFVLSIKSLNLDKAEEFLNSIPSQNKKKKAKEILDDLKKWKVDHEEVIQAGGLHILGTERHESRRIDNQLRGRSGRQGDPGSSRFYLSLEDDLMRIFGSDRISSIMQKLGMEEGQEIEHKMVSNAIARSQKRVEGHNFDIRKHLLEYDDVMNRQRQFVYTLRNDILDGKQQITDIIRSWIDEVIELQILVNCEGNNPATWNVEGLNEWLSNTVANVSVNLSNFQKSSKAQEELFDTIKDILITKYDQKAKSVGPFWQEVERNVFLEILDHRWKDHLYAMDHLRDGIWTVGYGEKNPLVEYKLQGFKMFDTMVDNLKQEIISFLYKVEVVEASQPVQEKVEYKKVGHESSNMDIFTESISKKDQHKQKHDNKSSSAGGASQRKKSRRKGH